MARLLRTFLLILGLLFFLFSCTESKKDINTDESILSSDLIDAFPPKELPINFQQKDLKQKESDSLLVKASVVTKFIPDTLFSKELGRLKDVRFYRKARYKAEETGETYLFLTAEKKEKKQVYLICFNEKDEFSAGMVLTENSNDARISHEGTLDKRLTILKNRTKQIGDGKMYYNKSAYVYNAEGLFTLILTESNEPVEDKVVYNPIDSLPAKDPLSGNYARDKKNFVSVRDGSKKGKLLFFINISQSGGNCEGSLRGDMTQVKPKVFQYNKADDHCVIEFRFQGKSLQVRELEACGNHRGVRCSFDGNFQKKK